MKKIGNPLTDLFLLEGTVFLMKFFLPVLYGKIVKKQIYILNFSTQEENHKDIADSNIDFLVSPSCRFGIIGAGSGDFVLIMILKNHIYFFSKFCCFIGSRS